MKPSVASFFAAMTAVITLGAAELMLPSSALAAETLIVSSEKDNRLYVLDPDGNPLAQIPVCKRPRDLKQRGKLVLVSCGESDAIGVVDLTQKRLLRSIAVSKSPEMFDLSSDGTLIFLSSEDDNELAAYELESGKKRFAVKTGNEPEGILLSPDGKMVFVTSEEKNVVHVISLEKRRIEHNLAVGKRPRRLLLVQDGRELWVSNELEASVSIVDLTQGKTVHTLRFDIAGVERENITPVGMIASADGKTVWVALGRANRVAEVDVPGRSVRRYVLAGQRAWGLGLSADGSRLYVTNGLSDDLTIIDANAGKALRSVPVGRVPHSVLVVP